MLGQRKIEPNASSGAFRNSAGPLMTEAKFAMFAKPDPDRLASAYRRIVAGDAAAREELAQLTLEPLAGVLGTGWGRNRDASMAHDAAVDAIMGLLRSPQSYVPARSSLWSFLEMAGRRNLADIRTSERRRSTRIGRGQKNVALRHSAPNKFNSCLLDRLAEREASDALWCVVNNFVRSLLPAEDRVLKLMASGVRTTPEYARVLGMEATPPGEQRRP